ncbi:DUF192 domain-containing protein [Phormidium sp. CLA17]|nr:DUF192 domain-containing protein [Leptolyngbya sp. Cla-17]
MSDRTQRQYTQIVSGGILVLGLLVSGCSSPVASVPLEKNTTLQTSKFPLELAKVGQMLPISAQIQAGDQLIQLEVARTVEQQSMGLMYRTALDANRGMLFPFSPPRPVSFWMKNVVINLDMIFLRNGQVVSVSSNVPPCKSEPCPFYGPKDAVDQVIELRGGRAIELGIKPGDRLLVQFTTKNPTNTSL